MKKTSKFLLQVLCAGIFFALFFNGVNDCNDTCELIGEFHEVKVTYKNNTKEDLHLFRSREEFTPQGTPENKVKAGKSRTETERLQIYAFTDTDELDVAAFKDGRVIGQKSYRLDRSVKKFTVTYPW